MDPNDPEFKQKLIDLTENFEEVIIKRDQCDNIAICTHIPSYPECKCPDINMNIENYPKSPVTKYRSRM